METKIYKVQLVYETCVSASDWNSAYEVLKSEIPSIVSTEDPQIVYDGEVTNLNSLSESWRLAIPWGYNQDELTVEQILTNDVN